MVVTPIVLSFLVSSFVTKNMCLIELWIETSEGLIEAFTSILLPFTLYIGLGFGEGQVGTELSG